MAWLQSQTAIPNLGVGLFGVVSALCFFVPGWKYYRLARKNRQLGAVVKPVHG
jgi:hypothetical protein